LKERHVLLQVDNSVITSVLEKYHWDGAIRPAGGDFLMVVDTNVGFNKTNAVVESSQVYEVDLTKTGSPQASLTVVHTNKATGIDSCNHWENYGRGKELPNPDCYWVPACLHCKGNILLDDAIIPADWMIINIGPRVDVLDENIGARDSARCGRAGFRFPEHFHRCPLT
jgi:hypothetical protein